MATDKPTTWQRINPHNELGLAWWDLSNEFFWGEEAVLYRCTVCYRALAWGLNLDKGRSGEEWLYEIEVHDQDGVPVSVITGYKMRFQTQEAALAYVEQRVSEPCRCQGAAEVSEEPPDTPEPPPLWSGRFRMAPDVH